jgi:hypothetical protein
MNNNDMSEFYETVSANLEIIATSTSQLAEKSFIDGPVANSVISAIVAALAAYVFTHLHWKHIRRKENICSAARSLYELINKLEEISIQYWLSTITMKNDDTYATEIQIKSLLRTQIGLFNQLEKLITKGNSLNNLRISIYEDFDLISGGDFEGKLKNSNPRIAAQIGATCAKIKIQLSSIMLEV